MTNPPENSTSGLRSTLRRTAFALALLCALTIVVVQSAQAQTFTVIHNFMGGDGAVPYAGLTIDHAGNFYGTTYKGGSLGIGCNDCGAVFKLSRAGSGWVLNTLYTFRGNFGDYPGAGVVFGPDGSLYGTASSGGSSGYGTVYRLRPPANACTTVLCSWDITALYNFSGPDGQYPGLGNVAFDAAGNLYGTTPAGGCCGLCDDHSCGVLYELSPMNGGWTETVLHYFYDDCCAYFPNAGVIMDSAGNLYGTTPFATGVVYQVRPEGTNSPFVQIYGFPLTQFYFPEGGLIFDQSGNLYGTTATGGSGNGGIVFELVGQGGGIWTFKALYNFSYSGSSFYPGPQASVTMDAAGNLYGTTNLEGANGCGSVFKLTPSNGSWNYTSLHDFSCGRDGAYPYSNVVFDSAGNLYGTASAGGTGSQCAGGCGTVWEITP